MSEIVKVLTRNDFEEKDRMAKNFYSFTDPYSKGLARFFKDIAVREPVQAVLFKQYLDYPELRGTVIKMEEDSKTGDLLGFKIKPKAYAAAKKRLKF